LNCWGRVVVVPKSIVRVLWKAIPAGVPRTDIGRLYPSRRVPIRVLRCIGQGSIVGRGCRLIDYRHAIPIARVVSGVEFLLDIVVVSVAAYGAKNDNSILPILGLERRRDIAILGDLLLFIRRTVIFNGPNGANKGVCACCGIDPANRRRRRPGAGAAILDVVSNPDKLRVACSDLRRPGQSPKAMVGSQPKALIKHLGHDVIVID